jgi:prophage regulatory protein
MQHMKLIDYEGLRAKGFEYSRPHIWRLIQAGRFPKPIQFGQGQGSRNVWVEEELDELIKQKMAQRENAAA